MADGLIGSEGKQVWNAVRINWEKCREPLVASVETTKQSNYDQRGELRTMERVRERKDVEGKREKEARVGLTRPFCCVQVRFQA